MKLSSRAKELLIACHPDRHGGDHSAMELFFAASKPHSKSKSAVRYCTHPGCGTPVSGGSVKGRCNVHGRYNRLKLQAVATCVLMFAGLAVSQLPPLPFPKAKLVAVSPVTTNRVFIDWQSVNDPMVQGYSVNHQSTGGLTRLNVGNLSNATVGLLPGPNTLQVFAYDATGSNNFLESKLLTITNGATIPPFKSIQPSHAVHTFAVRWLFVSGRTNVLMRSADLTKWDVVAQLTGTNLARVVRTNIGKPEFFRVAVLTETNSPAVPRVTLDIQPDSYLQSWPAQARQAYTVQQLARAESGSWTNVATVVATNAGTLAMVTKTSGSFRVLKTN